MSRGRRGAGLPAAILAAALATAGVVAVGVVAVAWAPVAPPAVAGEMPANWRKRFAREAYLSDKEDLVRDLAAAGGFPAREALVWCAQQTAAHLELELKDAERAAAKVAPLQAEFEAQLRRFLEESAKRGDPNPERRPVFAVDEPLTAARAEMWEAEKRVAACRSIRATVLRAHGELVDSLPPKDQDKVRDDLVKDVGTSKDWLVRAEIYESLAYARAPWALHILQDAARKEPDPRALVAALDALGGRDPALTVPTLVARLDDPRWIVRAAALAALERTPSRETIDAVLARFAKEDGRLRDDCLRVLVALTGGRDVTPTPESWAQWWAMKRAAWSGPPKERPLDPDRAGEDVPAASAKKTGFFGIDVRSRRLAFVIDVSGSMNEPVEKGARETRAQRAKEELVRAIRGLEDGAWFNIVLFSNDVRPWKDSMQLADAESRNSAVAFVEAAAVVGSTATYDALEFGFRLGDVGKGKQRGADPSGDARLDTIVFLSDGKPTTGRVVDPDAIRTAIREWYRSRRVTVHTIGFGKDVDVGFLDGLAKDTGGTSVFR